VVIKFNHQHWTVYFVIKSVILARPTNPRKVGVIDVHFDLIETRFLGASWERCDISLDQFQELAFLGSR
jgi:hypothetical protein